MWNPQSTGSEQGIMTNVAQWIKQKAEELGFSACGIASIDKPLDDECQHLDDWLKKGYHAGMTYMANHREIRRDPKGLVDGARSIISVAINYYPASRRDPALPHIAYYAYGKDYHDVVREKLRQLWTAIQTEAIPLFQLPKAEARVFTDSAPLFERYWAWRCGLGWIGKNSCLILPGKGSFFFLGEIVTTLSIESEDRPMPDRCGTCDRCLRACPTGALEAPRRLNANHCLSYLTIEHKGEIPHQEATLLGNRLYGCDSCQLACPWNRFASPTNIPEFHPSSEFLSLDEETLHHLTLEDYRRIFKGSAIKRAKYEGLIRNFKAMETADKSNIHPD